LTFRACGTGEVWAMIEATLSDSQKQLRTQVRDFVKSVPRQLILDLDAEKVTYPKEYLQEAARRQLLGLRFPAEWGGRGLDWQHEIVALEETGALPMSLACL
jgi:alkylation response protein AidB-like acyl-CoA dehydrogenase